MPRKELAPNVFGQPGQPSIDEYLKARDAYCNLPGKIKKGKMKILLGKEWLSPEELNLVFKRPVMPDFTANLNNCDKTKLWMYK